MRGSASLWLTHACVKFTVHTTQIAARSRSSKPKPDSEQTQETSLILCVTDDDVCCMSPHPTPSKCDCPIKGYDSGCMYLSRCRTHEHLPRMAFVRNKQRGGDLPERQEQNFRCLRLHHLNCAEPCTTPFFTQHLNPSEFATCRHCATLLELESAIRTPHTFPNKLNRRNSGS